MSGTDVFGAADTIVMQSGLSGALSNLRETIKKKELRTPKDKYRSAFGCFEDIAIRFMK